MKDLYKNDFTYSTSIVFEHEIQFNGYSFLVIFGRHVNGGFIAIPNWGICCEASADGSYLYNTEKLNSTGLDLKSSETIARYISDFFKKPDNSDMIDEIDAYFKDDLHNPISKPETAYPLKGKVV